MTMQYRAKGSTDYYAPSRDVIHWFTPVLRGVMELMCEEFPDRHEELMPIVHATSETINEAITGSESLPIERITSKLDGALHNCASDLVFVWRKHLIDALVFRYVAGMREQEEGQVDVKELSKAFTGMYLLSILPPEIAKAARDHLQTYAHLPEILFENEPPAVKEEDSDA